MIYKFTILAILMMMSFDLQSQPMPVYRKNPKEQEGGNAKFSNSSNKSKKKHRLAICAVFSNEAKYLNEWIEYHRMIGVDHFYLYSNNSTDRFASVLRPYMDKGIVTLTYWSDQLKEPRDSFIWSVTVQLAAYENAIHWRALKETEWLAILDIDEFLVPVNGRPLTELLEKYKQFPGIVLSRTYYDASLTEPAGKNRLVIEAEGMIKNPLREYIPKKIEKMIFKPELCERFSWPPYRCLFKNDQEPVVLTQYEGKVNQYSNRNQKIGTQEKHRPILQIDRRLFPEQQIEELLDCGYRIADSEKAIYRFIPGLRARMGY